MSKELAERMDLHIGEKVLYIHYVPYVVLTDIVTIKDVSLMYNGEVVINVEEFEGYINLVDVHTKNDILRMFENVTKGEEE